MPSNNFPELDGWSEIREKPAHGDALGIIDATHRLVMAIANLRSAASSQIGYLKKSIDEFNNTSSKLYKANIWLTAIIAYATLMNVVVSLDFGKKITATVSIVAAVLCWLLVRNLLKK